MMTFTQFGLLADIVGVMLLLPRLNWKKTGIPFHPTVWNRAWWLMVAGALLVVGGFVMQFIGTFN
ncbi:MAG: hypothetical protein HOL66_13410 [Rhodospirillaceae bacterium]|nr:hypothetical protein [Rhodospirillaceae bacterium]MBT5245229.1 hypothetical protein [Rhodospirillaceae bacterium]MBT5562760.1 hypothetical protein [Rhodospirillaceae bacterium]MBT6241927.1 hypothetical protein [Rhodospirillaceae bacterium]MBT7137834.1 hypothetical protein [Rhodospirillaceae bacterium]